MKNFEYFSKDRPPIFRNEGMSVLGGTGFAGFCIREGRERGGKLFNYLTPSPSFKNGLDEEVMLLCGVYRIGISRDEITLRLNGGAIFPTYMRGYFRE